MNDRKDSTDRDLALFQNRILWSQRECHQWLENIGKTCMADNSPNGRARNWYTVPCHMNRQFEWHHISAHYLCLSALTIYNAALYISFQMYNSFSDMIRASCSEEASYKNGIFIVCVWKIYEVESFYTWTHLRRIVPICCHLELYPSVWLTHHLYPQIQHHLYPSFRHHSPITYISFRHHLDIICTHHLDTSFALIICTNHFDTTENMLY